MFTKKIHPASLAQSGLLAVILLGPVLALVPQLVQTEWTGLFSPSRHALLLVKSAGFSTMVTVGSMALGLAAASAIWSRAPRFAPPIALGLLALIALPPYLHALAWKSLAGTLGWVGVISGWGAAWWVQVMALAPIATGLVLLGLVGVDAKLIRAARMTRSDARVFFQIVLPLASPALKAAAAIVFLMTITDYTIAQSFQCDTYAFEIFVEFSASRDAGQATLVALPVLALSLAVLTILLMQFRQMSVRTTSVLAHSPLQLTFWGRLVQSAGLSLLLVQVLAIVVGLGVQITSLTGLGEALMRAAPAMIQSTGVAALAAGLSVPLGFAAAYRILRPGWLGRAWAVLVTLPLALPGPLVGIGLVVLWNRPAVAWIYDSGAILVLTGLTRFLPLSAFVALVALSRIDLRLLWAAQVQAPSRFLAWLQVRAPLLLPAGLVGLYLVFVLSLGELPASLVTAPAGSETLPALIYGYLHYGASDRVAGLSLALPVLALLAAGLLIASKWAWRAVLPSRAKPGKRT